VRQAFSVRSAGGRLATTGSISGITMQVRSLFRHLHAADVVIAGFGGILGLLSLIFAGRIPDWRVLILLNLILLAVVGIVAFAEAATGGRILGILHDWYVVPAIIVYYEELHSLIGPIRRGRDYDRLLISIDRHLFGTDPTRWLAHVSTPLLTEILQIAYTLFYVLFILAGLELYRRYNRDSYDFFAFLCAYGFFLSYVGYFILPAAGPRFTLHDHSRMNTELPGLFLTPYLRWFVDWGGSVPMGVPNEVAMAGAQRDIFPSGHTMMTLVLIYYSYRCRLRVRHFVLVTGVLIIVAAVYQRYHYVVDVIAGVLFAAVCLLTCGTVYRFIRRHILRLAMR
jgi:membrane-associated phospholipid phosphatase